jgi:hypothetical protein
MIDQEPRILFPTVPAEDAAAAEAHRAVVFGHDQREVDQRGLGDVGGVRDSTIPAPKRFAQNGHVFPFRSLRQFRMYAARQSRQ